MSSLTAPWQNQDTRTFAVKPKLTWSPAVVSPLYPRSQIKKNEK